MTGEYRTVRNRQSDLVDKSDVMFGNPNVDITSMMAVKIYNGGSMPTSGNKWFLSYPVEIDGDEGEGEVPTFETDATRTVPVLVVGTRVPAAGDVLTAVHVGGRWIAESGASNPVAICTPCSIPKKTLTVSWTNTMLGNGSAPLVYRPPNLWSAACVNQLVIAMDCLAGIIQFVVTYFVSGSCPSGQFQSCQSPGFDPFGLTLVEDYTCDPFHLHYHITGAECPLLSGSGYTDFYIDE